MKVIISRDFYFIHEFQWQMRPIANAEHIRGAMNYLVAERNHCLSDWWVAEAEVIAWELHYEETIRYGYDYVSIYAMPSFAFAAAWERSEL